MAMRWFFPAIVGLLFVASPALADMLISPTRALLDNNTRSTSLVLRNTSSGARTYRLSWQDKRMSEAGRYVSVEEDEAWPSAGEMIRFSPRQITVGPGENQTVRLNYRPPGDLAPGEYRSHLRLQVLADVSEPISMIEMDGPEDQEGIDFLLAMQMSYSIPVIVRHNVDAPSVVIADVKVLPAEQHGDSMALQVTLEKKGAVSSYGAMLVEMQQDASSPVETIGRRKEVTVFHEEDQRVMQIPLRDASIPRGAWIRIAYEGRGEYDGRIWDEQVFQSE